MSLDYESALVCPRQQPRQPDALMGRRPRPTCWPTAVVRPTGPRPAGGPGDETRSARGCLS